MNLTVSTVAGHTFLGSLLNPESTVVDLGMNHGKFCYEMQQRFGCRITGVEANPDLAKAITPNERLTCSSLAIARETGPIEFFVDLYNNEASSTTLTTKATKSQKIIVEGNTFADFLAARHLDSVDLLKIDIEGAELDLLEETPDSILQNIRQICVEFHGFLRPSDLPRIKAVIDKMRTRNFFVLDFTRDLSNVLMVNEKFHKLSVADRAILHLTRNVQGMKRMVNRQFPLKGRESSN